MKEPCSADVIAALLYERHGGGDSRLQTADQAFGEAINIGLFRKEVLSVDVNARAVHYQDNSRIVLSDLYASIVHAGFLIRPFESPGFTTGNEKASDRIAQYRCYNPLKPRR